MSECHRVSVRLGVPAFPHFFSLAAHRHTPSVVRPTSFDRLFLVVPLSPLILVFFELFSSSFPFELSAPSCCYLLRLARDRNGQKKASTESLVSAQVYNVEVYLLQGFLRQRDDSTS